MILRRRAQSLIEYSILLIVIVGAFIAMQIYLKRGIQGKWKASVDDFGEQYDPWLANSQITYSLISNSDSSVFAVPATDPNGNPIPGFVTNRTDKSNAVETKQGTTVVGPF